MKRIAIVTTALLSTFVLASPAQAKLTHTHYCNCGHPGASGLCGGSTSSTSSTTSSTGGTTTSSSTGGTTTSTSTGGTTTSTSTGGTTTSSSSTGGTDVPEPGMLGLMGLGFIGLAIARRRRA